MVGMVDSMLVEPMPSTSTTTLTGPMVLRIIFRYVWIYYLYDILRVSVFRFPRCLGVDLTGCYEVFGTT